MKNTNQFDHKKLWNKYPNKLYTNIRVASHSPRLKIGDVGTAFLNGNSVKHTGIQESIFSKTGMPSASSERDAVNEGDFA